MHESFESEADELEQLEHYDPLLPTELRTAHPAQPTAADSLDPEPGGVLSFLSPE